jgi:hypothetical protein
MIRVGMCVRRWQGFDKICDSFTDSLTIPKKLYSHVTIFTPADHRYFYCQGDWLLSYSNLQGEIGSCIQRNVAAHSASGGREVEQNSFSFSGIALDTGRVNDWNSKTTSRLHCHALRCITIGFFMSLLVSIGREKEKLNSWTMDVGRRHKLRCAGTTRRSWQEVF